MMMQQPLVNSRSFRIHSITREGNKMALVLIVALSISVMGAIYGGAK
jgi:hypothetical protein